MNMEAGRGFEEAPKQPIDFEKLKGSLPVLLAEGKVPPDLVQSSLDALDRLPGSLGAVGRELLLEKLKATE